MIIMRISAVCWVVAAGGVLLSRGAPVDTNRVVFREPHPRAYRLQAPIAPPRPGPVEWVRAASEQDPAQAVQLGRRVVVQVEHPEGLAALLRARGLTVESTLAPNLFVLLAPDAWSAVRAAESLAGEATVRVSHPVMRRPLKRLGSYAAPPNDSYFGFDPAKPPSQYQWYLENRDTNGQVLGVDLNVRAAWPLSRGQGTLIAVADEPMETTHPDLVGRTTNAPHYDFEFSTPKVQPATSDAHATCVAGLAAAQGDNHLGIIGVAPLARLASWVALPSDGSSLDSLQMATLFGYASNVVSVQNHSWGLNTSAQDGPSVEEKVAITNAVLLGRQGRGEVIVRAGGNDRQSAWNANDDGYTSDPLAVAVAAVNFNGRFTTYSTAGACLLVAAPGGDGVTNLLTTDRSGSLGYNPGSSTATDPADPNYVGFAGTSGASPLVAGVVALVLAANTNLTARDTQQILLLAARHHDLADPDLVINGAGLAVSHNVGFGIPDAAEAVRLARHWSNRPPRVMVTFTNTTVTPIPDDGLRVVVTGNNIPASVASIPATSGLGLHPDAATPDLPALFVGQVTAPLSQNLTGQVAIIQRGVSLFSDKIAYAAQAGACAAVIFNNAGDTRVTMANTEFSPIDNVFIGQTSGQTLTSVLATNSTARVRLQLLAAVTTFTVTNTLQCEHVALRVMTDHPARSDVRITLVSPAGTRSVLQTVNLDPNAGPVDWTYYSTHHFYESSAGVWRVEVSDEQPGYTGHVLRLELTLTGVSLLDTDHDGLDDRWEMAHFGSLSHGPTDDPDGDGYCNSREQVMGTDPLTPNAPLQLDLSRLQPSLWRLSWPASTNHTYQVWAQTNLSKAFLLQTNRPGQFPEIEWIFPTNQIPRFLRVQQL